MQPFSCGSKNFLCQRYLPMGTPTLREHELKTPSRTAPAGRPAALTDPMANIEETSHGAW
ncbi:MAG: hypothetical protein ACYCWN_01135 [Ferrimicrobium sp.]|uniref:Uncharacterized protein n=1 Tax=Ferrimicrobium acidiphilum TaxID=121039 RepID=A0ABV3Y2L8_9ACTN|nr:hypothetical protein [Ferrimicrobium sp.]